jgi:hypothetical protein
LNAPQTPTPSISITSPQKPSPQQGVNRETIEESSTTQTSAVEEPLQGDATFTKEANPEMTPDVQQPESVPRSLDTKHSTLDTPQKATTQGGGESATRSGQGGDSTFTVDGPGSNASPAVVKKFDPSATVVKGSDGRPPADAKAEKNKKKKKKKKKSTALASQATDSAPTQAIEIEYTEPEYTLNFLPSSDGGAGAFVLKVVMPSIPSAGDVDLSVDPRRVTLHTTSPGQK